MKISVIHPSRGRIEQAYRTFRNWMNKSDDSNNFEYILSVDSDQNNEYYKRFIGIADKPKIFHNFNKSAIEAINNAAKRTTGDILLIVSDDTDCIEHWDTLLLKALEGKSNFCAKTDDGLQPTLITMPIMDRIYYERYGYVYHPDFLHMFADQELTAVAMMTGKYIKLDLSFPHLHYSTGKSPKDEVNVRNDMTWKQGQRLFDRHLENNFGIENPVMAYTDIQWK